MNSAGVSILMSSSETASQTATAKSKIDPAVARRAHEAANTENFLEPGVAGKRRNEVNHVILFKITRAGEALFMGSCVILVLSTEHYSQCTGDCIIVMYRRLTYVIKLESNEQTLNGTHSRP